MKKGRKEVQVDNVGMRIKWAEDGCLRSLQLYVIVSNKEEKDENGDYDWEDFIRNAVIMSNQILETRRTKDE